MGSVQIGHNIVLNLLGNACRRKSEHNDKRSQKPLENFARNDDFIICLSYQVPFLKSLKSRDKSLPYSKLDVAEKPKLLEPESLQGPTARMHFMKRVYDFNPYPQFAR